MKTYYSFEDVRGLGDGAVVTIGVYDGVHIGHRKILRELQSYADELHLPSVVVTFHPHPAAIVHPDAVPPLICSLERRLELLEEDGVDVVVVVEFDQHFRSEEAQEFIDRVLVDSLHAKAVIVGSDFRFGRERAGDVEMLRIFGEKRGYIGVSVDLSYVHEEKDGYLSREALQVGGQPDVREGGQMGGRGSSGSRGVVQEPMTGDSKKGVQMESKVSSSLIRQLVSSGDIVRAAKLLGRYFELSGTVVEGHRRGGPLLGYATANIAIEDGMLLPADGVYAGWFVMPGGRDHACAISVGVNPTFSDREAVAVEAHLLDFNGNLYGERATVKLVQRIRGQEKFPSPEELKSHIAMDIEEVRKILA